MKNLKIKTTKTVESEISVPEYFRINESQYFRLVSDNSYVCVSFYDVTPNQMESLILYPQIEVKMLSHLYIYIQDKQLIELTKEEFTERFDKCVTFMDTL